MKLEELQRLAEAATPTWRAVERTYALDDHKRSYFSGVVDSDGDNVCLAGFSLSGGKQAEANGRYCAAMSPDTAKKLIAAARAGEEALEFFTTYCALNEQAQDDMAEEKSATLDELRTALEELK